MKRLHPYVPCVGSHTDIGVGGQNQKRMVKVSRFIAQLHHVAAQRGLMRYPVAVGPRAVFAQKIIPQILHPGKGRGAVIEGKVVPAVHGGRKIHDACACIETLAYKIGAVAAKQVKVSVGGIAAKRPRFGIAQGFFPVVAHVAFTSEKCMSESLVSCVSSEKMV